MPYKEETQKFQMIKQITKWVMLLMTISVMAQTPVSEDVKAEDAAVVQETVSKLRDSVKPKQDKILVDGVQGVIGDYVILDSDIKKAQLQIARGSRGTTVSNCQLMESILREKMYAHHAIQDSIIVTDRQVEAQTEQMIDEFVRRAGSEEEVASIYNMENIDQVRTELNRINRDRILAERMEQAITEKVEITPEEVRQFFASLEKEDIPIFNTEVEMAQIVVNPQPSEDAVQEVLDKLNAYRKDVIENGASFHAKAVLYSDDTETGKRGGKITVSRDAPLVKEFKDVAFSTEEGQVSKPFKTQFGYHIIQVDKIRGQVRDVRHILLIPFISTDQVAKARAKLQQARDSIILGQVTFEEMAKRISDEEQTAKDGGRLIDPVDGDSRIDLTLTDPELVQDVQLLDKGDVSEIIEGTDKRGKQYLKLIYLIDRIEDHTADYATDYLKIKELALSDKKVKEVEKWQEKKLRDTYIMLGEEFSDCDFLFDWTR
jgi:peptidyl-prolyl cis-trans isomerase SurA